MKIFVAGAAGVIGRRLVPSLVRSGHGVVGLTRTPDNAEFIRASGAEPMVANGLDRAAMMDAVARAAPDVIVHQMSSLTGAKSFKHFDDEFAVTNRLRIEGTDNLLEAARAAGVRRLIAQSFGGWNLERTGTSPKAEDDPLDSSPPANQRRSMDAIRHLERVVPESDGIEGLALRYGTFYGPGTGFALDGDLIALIRKRRLPIVGNGAGVWSFIHVNDVVTATMAAITRGAPGIYHIVDDEPAPVAEWLPFLARSQSAPPPRRVPVWLGRLAIGEVGVSMMTQIRGASNEKAKQQLDWKLQFATWRDGFRTGLGDVPLPDPLTD
jgi:nucleoside-diphosphate-sugar epimerase